MGSKISGAKNRVLDFFPYSKREEAVILSVGFRDKIDEIQTFSTL